MKKSVLLTFWLDSIYNFTSPSIETVCILYYARGFTCSCLVLSLLILCSCALVHLQFFFCFVNTSRGEKDNNHNSNNLYTTSATFLPFNSLFFDVNNNVTFFFAAAVAAAFELWWTQKKHSIQQMYGSFLSS